MNEFESNLFFGGMDEPTGRNRLDFGGFPDHELDPGIF